jgi:hypothetical protein
VVHSERLLREKCGVVGTGLSAGSSHELFSHVKFLKKVRVAVIARRRQREFGIVAGVWLRIWQVVV